MSNDKNPNQEILQHPAAANTADKPKRHRHRLSKLQRDYVEFQKSGIGLDCAAKAINMLRRIPNNDPEHRKALEKVLDHINIKLEELP